VASQIVLAVLSCTGIAALALLALRIHRWIHEPSAIQTGRDQSDASLALSDPDGPHAAVLDALQELGFELLGARWQRSPFTSIKSREVVLVHPEHACFAGVGSFELEPGFYLLSTFEDGAAVRTSNSAATRGGPTPGPTIRGHVSGGTPAEVLAVHQLRVDRLAAEERQLSRELDFEGRVAACATWNEGLASTEMGRTEARLALLLCLVSIAALGLMMLTPVTTG